MEKDGSKGLDTVGVVEYSGMSRGGLAQLGERCLRKAEVGGSTPLPSTTYGAGWAARTESRIISGLYSPLPARSRLRQPK